MSSRPQGNIFLSVKLFGKDDNDRELWENTIHEGASAFEIPMRDKQDYKRNSRTIKMYNNITPYLTSPYQPIELLSKASNVREVIRPTIPERISIAYSEKTMGLGVVW